MTLTTSTFRIQPHLQRDAEQLEEALLRSPVRLPHVPRRADEIHGDRDGLANIAPYLRVVLPSDAVPKNCLQVLSP